MRYRHRPGPFRFSARELFPGIGVVRPAFRRHGAALPDGPADAEQEPAVQDEASEEEHDPGAKRHRYTSALSVRSWFYWQTVEQVAEHAEEEEHGPASRKGDPPRIAAVSLEDLAPQVHDEHHHQDDRREIAEERDPDPPERNLRDRVQVSLKSPDVI